MKYYIIILIGIYCCGCSSSDETEEEASTKGKWQSIDKDSYYATNNGICFQIGEYVYSGLGESYSGGVDSFGNFFKSRDGYNWKKIALFPGESRERGVSFVLNGKAYIGIGRSLLFPGSQVKYYKDFWCYDPETDKWSEATEFPGLAREGSVAFTVVTKGKDENTKEISFVGCGSSGTEYLNDFYSFDGTTWTEIKIPLGSRRYGGNAFVINNTAYIFGGYKYYDKVLAEGDPEFAKDIVYYKGYPSDMWGVIKDGFNSDSLTRAFASSFVIKSNDEEKGYLICGISYGSGHSFYNSTCWEFAPQTNQWEKIAPLPAEITPRSAAVTFNIGNEGYCAFGNYSGRILKDIWKFTP